VATDQRGNGIAHPVTRTRRGDWLGADKPRLRRSSITGTAPFRQPHPRL